MPHAQDKSHDSLHDQSIAARIKQAGLPEHYNVHWSDTRKAQIVGAVRDRLITLDEARDRYLLSRSEFQSWKDRFEKTGQPDKALELH